MWSVRNGKQLRDLLLQLLLFSERARRNRKRGGLKGSSPVDTRPAKQTQFAEPPLQTSCSRK